MAISAKSVAKKGYIIAAKQAAPLIVRIDAKLEELSNATAFTMDTQIVIHDHALWEECVKNEMLIDFLANEYEKAGWSLNIGESNSDEASQLSFTFREKWYAEDFGEEELNDDDEESWHNAEEDDEDL